MFDKIQTFTPQQLKKAVALRKQAENKLNSMGYGNVTLKRVSNLSHSDVEDIRDAMDRLIETEQDPFFGLLPPSREIKQVFINAGVYTDTNA